MIDVTPRAVLRDSDVVEVQIAWWLDVKPPLDVSAVMGPCRS